MGEEGETQPFSFVFFLGGGFFTLLEEQKKKRKKIGKSWKKFTYETNLPEPPKQRSPFVESIQDDPRGRFGSAQGAGTQH